jgi:citrate lyase subunit beta/citryl-CoA lyase
MIRSMLYVPASSERFIAKAHERGADAIVLDLEDSVVPEKKERARAGLMESVRAVSQKQATVFVRVNSPEDLLYLDAEAACRAGAFGLLVPKVGAPETLQHLARQMDEVEHSIARKNKTVFVPLIEDPAAIFAARAIASATPRVFGMMTGGEDLCTAMGADPVPEVVRFPALLVHFAAKAAGIFSFGLLRSVADYRDIEGIKSAAEEARRFGFDGASCVHPQVVPLLNEAFSPSASEIDRATRLIRAYEESQEAGKGACVFEGKMVDVPVVQRARALLGRQHK